MKKAILIVGVLLLLALVAAPVLADVLTGGNELDRQMGPRPEPSIGGACEAERPAQIAGYWRRTSPLA